MNKIARLLAPLRRALNWPLRVAAARREFALLATMDERALADIGLCRQDLNDMTALPFAQAPGDALAERVEERRAARALCAASARPRRVGSAPSSDPPADRAKPLMMIR